MHLKNFSLYRPSKDYLLTPAYDLLNVAIANPKDEEEMALSLSGRKTKLRLADFLNAAKTMGLEESVVLRLIAGLHKALPQWRTLIHHSFLSEEMKNRYEELITSRLSRL
jgi:serine/threonine-protein kinase HipA